MSELKITYNSLENAILRDGQLVFGYVQDSESKLAANGNGTFAEGYVADDGILNASGAGSYAGGYVSPGHIIANGYGTYAFGYSGSINGHINSSGYGSHAEGYVENNGKILAFGKGTYVNGFADDDGTIIAKGNGAQAEGYVKNGHIDASGNGAQAEGCAEFDGSINAFGKGAHAEGINTNALNDAAHAEGEGCYEIKQSCYGGIQITSLLRVGQTAFLTNTDITIGNNIYNYNTTDLIAIINYRESGGQGYDYRFEVQTYEQANVLAELHDSVPVYVTNYAPRYRKNYITLGASGYASHTEGINTQATTDAAHAEGQETIASGIASHAEGIYTQSLGDYSHAEGISTQALADGAHAGGIGTIANSSAMTAIGKYNSSDADVYGDMLFVIGNGNNNSRKNALSVNTNGATYFNNNYVYFNTYENDDCYIKYNGGDLNINVNNYLHLNADDGIKINNDTVISGSATISENISCNTLRANNSVYGKVNDVPNVQLGVPIGSMTMWLGASKWAGYHYAVENDPYYIPDGWLLANGASVRLRYLGQQNRSAGQHVTYYHNNTDYVYIPRYTTNQTHDNEFDHWDKFELIAYRQNEHQWVAVIGEQSKFDRPDDCYIQMTSSEKQIFTRFLNHIILSTRVYVIVYVVSLQEEQYEIRKQLVNNTSYNIMSSEYDASYLEIYTNDIRGVPIQISWYSNPNNYSDGDDILIALPDMNLKFPFGARQGDITSNFGNVSTLIGNPLSGTTYANTFIGASGGEETHNLELNEMYGIPQGTTAQNGTDLYYGTYQFTEDPQKTHPHNNIPPYMAVHFIIKYK